MHWDDAIKEYTKKLKIEEITIEWIQRIYQLIDLTSLNETDTESSIAIVCEKAQSSLGHVAAVCTYPRFTKLVAAEFAGTPIKVAAVANFPQGTATLETTLIEIGNALQDGAQEIDVVFPYQQYLAGDTHYAHTFIATCKAACGENVTLKVIIETGALRDPDLIAAASKESILAGADFIKTSTGRVAEGATLKAAAVVLLVLRELASTLARPIGIKISGGIKELQLAIQFVQLAEYIMGREWVIPAHFRLGTSKLINRLLEYSREVES